MAGTVWQQTASEPITAPPVAPVLMVSEIFGPTFQGEGPSCGHRAVFLRLGGCNLACAWCDTPYTWDWSGQNGTRYDPRAEVRRVVVPDVAADLHAHGHPYDHLLVVTGGEPVLQQSALVALLAATSYRVEVETNGTIPPSPALLRLVGQWNVSPKLAHSGDAATVRLRPAALLAFRALPHHPDRSQVAWKFVVRHSSPHEIAADLRAIAAFISEQYIDPADVWIMPLTDAAAPATSTWQGLQRLAQPTLDAGYHLSPRLHTLIWGNDRGR